MRRLIPLLCCVLALAATGCGDDDATDDATDGPERAVTPAGDDPVLDDVTVSGTFDEGAAIELDEPLEVTGTVRRVLDEGDGEELATGVSVSFRHLAVNGRDGTEFDTSFGADPAGATLDESQVILGLVRGLLEVPVGSRVLVAVGSDEAFGEDGLPDVGIEPEDTIVFVVDVLDTSTPLERATGTDVEPVEGLPTVTLDEDGAPTITLPDEDPPSDLVAQLLIEGEGDEVDAGQTVSVHYTGIVWPGGEQFDSSWERGEPTSFGIGVGQVIEGWEEGLTGVPVGSQVLLVIPPEQGYGTEGNPAAGISGTDTLVFVVDVLDAV